MFDIFKKAKQLREAELDLQLKQYEIASKSLVEASNIVNDKELGSGNWFLLGSGDSNGIYQTDHDHKEMLNSAYTLYHSNPFARSIIRNLVKFVFGKGPLIVPKSENQKVKDYWKEFKKKNVFNKKEKEIGTRVFRDGEIFIRKFIDDENGDLKIRFIRSSRIGEPDSKVIKNASFGIITSPDDIEDVLGYVLIDNNKNYVKTIPASEVIHEKILSDSDQKRGISILRICAKRLTQYDQWLEDRIILNKVRSAIALVRKVDSSAARMKGIRDQNMSDNYSSSKNKQKMLRAGTIITATKGVEYEMLTANINASDVAEDGRSMLLSIAAAVGFPEMIFTADYSNANYSSSLVAQNPFVREIEDWQDFFTTLYEGLFADVIRAKKEFGDLPAEESEECTVEWPPMILADLEKLSKAYEILYKYKVVSKKTWRARMGLDNDLEGSYLDDEDDSTLFAPNSSGQFNMPIAPINQYGANISNYLNDGDIDSAIEECGKLIEFVEEYESKINE